MVRRLALARQAGQLDPGPDAELGEDVAQVRVHRVRGNVQPLGDLTVGRALGDQPDDRQLGGGQLRPARRGRVRAVGCALRAAVAEQAADPGGVPVGAGGGLQR